MIAIRKKYWSNHSLGDTRIEGVSKTWRTKGAPSKQILANLSYHSKRRTKPMKAILPRNGMAATGRPVKAWRFLVAFVPVFVFAAVVSTAAVAQVTDCTLLTFSEQLGTLPDGTSYGLRKPSNWNGVLINDLDYLPSRDTPRNCYWLGQGYALSGTQ